MHSKLSNLNAVGVLDFFNIAQAVSVGVTRVLVKESSLLVFLVVDFV